MAKYGQAIYGVSPYGQQGQVIYNANLSGTPIGYSGIYLSWDLPNIFVINELQLIKSLYGYVEGPDDGQVVMDVTTSVTTFYDTSPMQGGFYYYYTLIALTTVEAQTSWSVIGTSSVLLPTNFGYGSIFASWMPEFYLSWDDQNASLPGPLRRTLNLFGYETDKIATDVETLSNLNNVNLMEGSALPLLLNDLGSSYEPGLSMVQNRTIARNLVQAYQTKGTITGIETISSAYTGYGCVVTIGINQEAQLDTSAFCQSTGLWDAANATLGIV